MVDGDIDIKIGVKSRDNDMPPEGLPPAPSTRFGKYYLPILRQTNLCFHFDPGPSEKLVPRSHERFNLKSSSAIFNLFRGYFVEN